MKKIPVFMLAACFVAQVTQVFAQTAAPDSASKAQIVYQVGLAGLASSASNTPFWLRANQFGIIPSSNPVIMAGASIAKNYTRKGFDWGFGVEGWAYAGKENAAILPELYLKGKYGKLEIVAGRRKQTLGIVGDSVLTSGTYILSGNSIPMPQVQIGFIDYVPILKGLFSFKGSVVHGWFDSNPVVRRHYLHQKSAYIKFGKPAWPVRVSGGFNHNVQWGGEVVMPNRHTVGRDYPADWIDYWYVVSGKRIPTFGYVDESKYDAIDRGNRVGNHLGSLDFAVEIKVKSTDITLYRQFIYDDGSLYYKKGGVDGLNGISFKFGGDRSKAFRISGVTAEYLGTANQGGDSFTLDGGPRGKDDYFNHIQYAGWVYDDRTIGTPFITPKTSVSGDLPAGNQFKFSNNTRVKLFHLGISGSLHRLQWLCKISYSDNLGTYDRPFPAGTKQFSGLISATMPFHSRVMGDFDVQARLGTDAGKLYENSTGLYVSIVKRGILKR